MKKITTIYVIFGLLALIVLVILAFNLQSKDRVVYTDEATTISSPTVSRTDPMIGAKSPKIFIVQYGDFESSASNNISRSLENLLQEFGDDLVLIWKDFPNPNLHPEGIKASVAGECARKQGQFWDFQRLVIHNENLLGADLYTQISEDIGLYKGPFNRCLSKEKTMEKVQEDYNEAINLGLTGAPTLFINGESYTGLLSETELREIIKKKLTE